MTLHSDGFAPPFGHLQRDSFLAKLRHDFRNCLRPLLEIPAWIEEDLLEANLTAPESVRENLALLRLYGQRASYFFEDLMTLSNIGTDQTQNSRTITDILEQLGIDDLPMCFEFRQDIRHDSLPIPDNDAVILIDALLSNAVKHHDKETGVIAVSCDELAGHIQFSVCDNGPGIPEGFHKSAFDPFARMSRRDDLEGTGLGLFAVKSIAQLYNGHVRIISPGNSRGNCVVVRFPKTINPKTFGP